jgi:hypothetical protein
LLKTGKRWLLHTMLSLILCECPISWIKHDFLYRFGRVVFSPLKVSGHMLAYGLRDIHPHHQNLPFEKHFQPLQTMISSSIFLILLSTKQDSIFWPLSCSIHRHHARLLPLTKSFGRSEHSKSTMSSLCRFFRVQRCHLAPGPFFFECQSIPCCNNVMNSECVDASFVEISKFKLRSKCKQINSSLLWLDEMWNTALCFSSSLRVRERATVHRLDMWLTTILRTQFSDAFFPHILHSNSTVSIWSISSLIGSINFH